MFWAPSTFDEIGERLGMGRGGRRKGQSSQKRKAGWETAGEGHLAWPPKAAVVFLKGGLVFVSFDFVG